VFLKLWILRFEGWNDWARPNVESDKELGEEEVPIRYE